MILALLVTALRQDKGKKTGRWKGRNRTALLADNVIFCVENDKESKTKLLELISVLKPGHRTQDKYRN